MTVTLQDAITEKCRKCVLVSSPRVWSELRDSSDASTLVKGTTTTTTTTQGNMKTVKNLYVSTEIKSTHTTPLVTNSSSSQSNSSMQSKVRCGVLVMSSVARASQEVRPVLTWPWVTWMALLTLCCAQGLSQATTEVMSIEDSLPRFLEPIPNKTVVVGRDVILPCSVDNLKGFKVAWIFVETQTILTIHHTIITKNPRFSLARNDHKHWYLRITDVRPSDRGLYMCQVNSDPMMSQIGFLDVQVPPDIIDEESSSEVVVKEGQDVTLECRARGSPKPVISWKREDGGKIDGSNGINLKVTDSEVLHIPTVSRLHMGAYLCIASNDVPPSVSKRIILQVQFQPVLWIPNQLVGVASGMDVTLECHTESFPKSINYWTDERGQMILSSGRFDTIVAENGYKAYMRLKIRNIQPEDFMAYICYAKNSFGETNGSVKVYEIPRQLLVDVPDTRKTGGDRRGGKDEEEKEGEEEEEGSEAEAEMEGGAQDRTPGRSSEPQRESQTKKKKSGIHVTEEKAGQKRTGFRFDFESTSFHNVQSSSSSLHHHQWAPVLVVACVWFFLLVVKV